MDLSKLPRLSKTDRPGNPPEEAEQAGGMQVEYGRIIQVKYGLLEHLLLALL
ncbi:MAG: hypothetical protein NTU53_03670 [Planctomycetota bacterium]|nr:hypothetical protein [Planctomycetota bacterium]